VRDKSILDTLTKLQESTARASRAIAISVTRCGCIKISANKQPVPESDNLEDLLEYYRTHIEGSLCQTCEEKINEELGKVLFYTTAICSLLNLDLAKILQKENDNISTLGLYSLT
jgi:hypothetical protein